MNNELLIEQSIIGYKEFEMEVVRDSADNCIIVCSIENLDAMGVHTGDSITVAPAMTLTDKEYQRMREASITILREIGVDTGGSNVQFAVCPQTGELLVIEMNPRVSRSSALASKATGFPIAKVAAKLAVGYCLDELQNEITKGVIPASFEPTIDYVVTKIPRFAFEKFSNNQNALSANDTLGTQMKSVGEVMAMGRNFAESLQKALRGLEVGLKGLDSTGLVGKELLKCCARPNPKRLLALADAFRQGESVEKVGQLSGVDPWFLTQIESLVLMEKEFIQTTKQQGLSSLDPQFLKSLKRQGFSDASLAQLSGNKEATIRTIRQKAGIKPVFKRIDSCAAEFPSSTDYLYSTYETYCELEKSDKPKIVILGGGPNRIGQGIEFDYCCVHASFALKEHGFETIMINCNPETVSTDYDTSSRLYFEPLVFENVMDILEAENPDGVIVHFGGQTPLKLANQLKQAGIKIIGTSPESIDLAEDRQRFAQVLEKLGLKQPPHAITESAEKTLKASQSIGFPLLARPSYVLGGRAMEVVYDEQGLMAYLTKNASAFESGPLLLDAYLTHAIEVDVDVISDGKRSIIGGVLEHIEQAGVHSGDSACSLPCHSLDTNTQEKIKSQALKLAKALKVVGLMNVQFAILKGDIYVLEVNPRASRTVPFISKAIGVPLAKIASLVKVGIDFDAQKIPNISEFKPSGLVAVKEAVLPFNKFPEVDPLLGPEMRSTGEVMGLGRNFSQALIKAQISAKTPIQKTDCIFISVCDSDQLALGSLASHLKDIKPKRILATYGTGKALETFGIKVEYINKVYEGSPHIVDALENREDDFVINTDDSRSFVEDSALIRQTSLAKGIAFTTTLFGGVAMLSTLKSRGDLEVFDIKQIFTQA